MALVLLFVAYQVLAARPRAVVEWNPPSGTSFMSLRLDVSPPTNPTPSPLPLGALRAHLDPPEARRGGRRGRQVRGSRTGASTGKASRKPSRRTRRRASLSPAARRSASNSPRTSSSAPPAAILRKFRGGDHHGDDRNAVGQAAHPEVPSQRGRVGHGIFGCRPPPSGCSAFCAQLNPTRPPDWR